MLFGALEEVAHCRQKVVVGVEDDGHGPAADSGNQHGRADQQALEDVEQVLFHGDAAASVFNGFGSCRVCR